MNRIEAALKNLKMSRAQDIIISCCPKTILGDEDLPRYREPGSGCNFRNSQYGKMSFDSKETFHIKFCIECWKQPYYPETDRIDPNE